ncbi:MAG: hypothetical protein CL724_06630 [Chloroflexi bacterium]|nr:hypothetical protein [Chloroflexota bacterium]
MTTCVGLRRLRAKPNISCAIPSEPRYTISIEFWALNPPVLPNTISAMASGASRAIPISIAHALTFSEEYR